MRAANAPQSKPVELAGQPFALQVHDPKRGLRIAAADPLARHASIMPGMSLSEATALLPTLKILSHDPQADLLALQELTDCVTQFSPLVGIESVDTHPWVGRHLAEPQAILADVTRLTHFFGGPAEMAATVVEWLLQKGYLAVVAIAPSLGAAWAAANYGHHREQLTQAFYDYYMFMPDTLSELQVLKEKSDAFLAMVPPVVWTDEDLTEQVTRLDVAALRIDSATAKTLRRLGIQTVGALKKLPRSGIAPRLGKALLDRLDSLCGEIQEPIVCHHAGPDFYVDIALEIPTDRRDTIEELIRRLSLQLCERLQHHGQGALRVLCRLSTIERSILHLKLGLYQPTAEALHLQKLLLDQFERQVRMNVTVIAISLQADIVNALRWQQTSLFEQAASSFQNKTAELIDVLASRLGNSAVVQPIVRPDQLPEASCEFIPLTAIPTVETSKKKERVTRQQNQVTVEAGIAPNADQPLRRPLSLLQKPLQLEVISVFPNGPPIQFRWSGRIEQVVRHWGPERIETHWWSGPSQRRDYYRVETLSGAWLWLFRDLREHDWYLHGEFS